MTDEAETSRGPHRMQAVYDEIADHFSETRTYPWPEVEAFLAERDGAVGLDVGCGNGRHAAVLSDCVDTVLALDLSRELLFEARERMDAGGWHAECLQGNAARLPVADDTVDLAIYVATLHHLPDRESRVRSLSELARVLTDSGSALVSAWSTAHDRFEDREAGFDTTIDWTLPSGETVERFYHIYDPDEFVADLRRSELVIEESYLSSGNCYAEVR